MEVIEKVATTGKAILNITARTEMCLVKTGTESNEAFWRKSTKKKRFHNKQHQQQQQ